LGQGKGEYKGSLVVRKHLSRTGPGECEGSRKPPAVDLGEATGDADAWQAPGKVAEPTTLEECACGGGQEGCPNCSVTSQPLPHDRGAHPETITHIPNGHEFTDASGLTWRHGGTFDDCTTTECVQFRNRLNAPDTTRDYEHACEAGLFMLLRNCPVHGVPTPAEPVVIPDPHEREATSAIAAVEAQRMSADAWSKPGPASAAELPPVHGQPEPKRDRWGRYVFNGQSHTRATTFAKSASSTHALSEWRERMVVLGLTMRRDLLAMAHGKHVKRDRTELNSIAAQAKDAAGVKVAANLGTAYHAFSERLDAGLMTLEQVPEDYRHHLAEYQQAVAAHGLVTRPEWIERSTAVRADQVSAELPVGGTLDRIFQLPNGELVIGDLKTGSDLSYGWGEIAVQLAIYAHGVNTYGLFDWNTDTWQAAPGPVRTDYGIVIHLPAESSGCTLYRIDLAAGWRRAQVCGQVMAMQKSKDKLATEMFPEPRPSTFDPQDTWTHQHLVPKRSEHLSKGLVLAQTAASAAELEALYGYAQASGKFEGTELGQLKEACAARWTQLQGA
jgi:hypothetical protein